MATKVHIGRGIVFLMAFPLLLFMVLGWAWMTGEVLTLSADTLCLRREWWRVGRSSTFDIKRIRNRVTLVVPRAYCFAFDLDLGVTHVFGKDLELGRGTPGCRDH